MKRHFFPLIAFLLSFAPLSRADIDITDLYLQNAGFDDEAHFDYKKNENGNVAQEILPIYGWNKDIGVDYTITGIYELGTAKTFNTYGKVPTSGYNGSNGGCLALSTGWEETLKFFQTITLPEGSYKLQSAFYNGSNAESGKSLMGFVTNNGDAVLSTTSSFPLNQWTLDEISLNLSKETEGHLQIGFQGVAGGSANSAKVVVDFVKLYLVGDNNSLISNIRSTLNTTIASALKTYGNGDGKKAEELKKVIGQSQVNAENTSASYAELFKANEALKKALVLFEWANATIDHPSDFTKFIVNPNFEEGFNGWKQSELKIQTNSSFPLKSGQTYVEKWVSAANSVGDASVLQTIGSELPQGIYTLKASAQNLQEGATHQSGAWIMAENDSIEISEAKEYTLQFTHIENEFSFGFITHNASGNWVALDNFKLYYSAASTEDYKREMSRRMETGDELLKNRMCENHRKNLQMAIKQAEEWLNTNDENSMTSIATALRKATLTAQSSAEAFTRLANQIQKATKEIKIGGNSNEVLESAIQKAQTDLGNESLSIAEINASTQKLQNYILFYKTENSDDRPLYAYASDYLSGATKIFARSRFESSEYDKIIEKGFCWSTEKKPTILDNISTLSYENNGEIFVIEGLQPATFYYIRPYAITDKYALSYGDPIKVCTLPKGNVTWSYNNGGSDEENDRINNAIAEAVDIWNNITSIQGLHISVSYGASTPTADCSYGGSMRVGPNASYQRTGTIQHEMCHAAGVGTTDRWYNDGTYRENVSTGIWLGDRTDRVLTFLEAEEAHLKGDKTHFWPYGVNGAHEDTGNKMLYYANALIIQGLGEDFLPPVAGAFASPAYTFQQDDEQNYYILPADTKRPTMLQARNDGTLGLTETKWEDVRKDASLAWKITFNPKTQLYEFKNVQNKQAIANNSSEVKLSATDNFGLQLLGAREWSEIEYRLCKSYWMTFANGTNRPLTMAQKYNNIVAETFDHRNSAVPQRWIILSENDIREITGDNTGLQEESYATSSILVSNAQESLIIETTHKGEWIYIHDLQGRLLNRFYMQAGLRTTIPMASGLYLVNGQKAISLK